MAFYQNLLYRVCRTQTKDKATLKTNNFDIFFFCVVRSLRKFKEHLFQGRPFNTVAAFKYKIKQYKGNFQDKR